MRWDSPLSSVGFVDHMVFEGYSILTMFPGHHQLRGMGFKIRQASSKCSFPESGCDQLQWHWRCNIYATARRNAEDICYRRRNRLQHFSTFRTIDAIDYTDIATTSVDHCILDLAIEPSDNAISIVVLDGQDDGLVSHANLYEVGRHIPMDD